MKIFQAVTAEEIEEARTLFREYEQWLGIDLCFQSFEQELANLPGRYAQPSGELFLLEIDGETAGCVALRKIDAETCEMKRLFVRDEFRGTGAGRRLIERVIEAAKEIGYRRILLDTLPEKMPNAVRLYEHYGFHQTNPYYANPHETTLFMEKILD